jgi:hypothetical protein
LGGEAAPLGKDFEKGKTDGLPFDFLDWGALGLSGGLGLLGNFGDKRFCHGVLLVNSMVAKGRDRAFRGG